MVGFLNQQTGSMTRSPSLIPLQTSPPLKSAKILKEGHGSW